MTFDEILQSVGSKQIGRSWCTDLSLSDVQATQLADAIRQSKTLRAFHLLRCKVSAQGMSVIAKGIEDNTSLRELSIEDTALDQQSVFAIANAIAKSKIQKLQLDGCGVQKAIAKELGSVLSAAQQLNELSLDNNALADGVCDLLTALCDAPHLQSFSVERNGINDQSVAALFEQLRKKHISEIFLGYNAFTENGGVAAAKAMKENTTLKTVSVAGNRIGKLALSQIIAAIRTTRTLEWIELQFCGLTDDDVRHVATALKDNAKTAALENRHSSIENCVVFEGVDSSMVASSSSSSSSPVSEWSWFEVNNKRYIPTLSREVSAELAQTLREIDPVLSSSRNQSISLDDDDERVVYLEGDSDRTKSGKAFTHWHPKRKASTTSSVAIEQPPEPAIDLAKLTLLESQALEKLRKINLLCAGEKKFRKDVQAVLPFDQQLKRVLCALPKNSQWLGRLRGKKNPDLIKAELLSADLHRSATRLGCLQRLLAHYRELEITNNRTANAIDLSTQEYVQRIAFCTQLCVANAGKQSTVVFDPDDDASSESSDTDAQLLSSNAVRSDGVPPRR